ncbi:hypothetical protein PX554_11140 [Sphingomonas sp. H39-1-10]|uniref:DUF6628 family protein n=1 Tax=Sphingomonas TaxID=13687 RepID=UPI0008807245|nr:MULTISPECIES: DUF6628 family protein [Sphingomonas]MDF0488687.1 hypothetical protein [Sphingomonas pollutisoli]SDA12806.1 hypothetical protein SAMN03159340_00325 [Sphingomonas sp. NFR15]
MTIAPTTALTLQDMPDCDHARLFLFAFRRMGAHGLNDAVAAHAMLRAFGTAYRRPLMLMRALMDDIATHTGATIAIAPCCFARITHAEAAMLTVVARVEREPAAAALLLADLLGMRRPEGVLASTASVAAAFADAGRPIGRG